MRKFAVQCVAVAIGIGLLGTTRASAEPVTVTGGVVTARMTNGSFVFFGDGLWLSGAAFEYASGLWECSPCRAADRLNLNLGSTASGSFDSGLPGDFNGVHYDATWLAGHLAFTAPDMTSAILTGQRSITMPFTFSGELLNFDSFASRAAGRSPVFIAKLTGSGFATARFTGPVADPNGALFFADSITYEFRPAAPSPTPEPASLLLLGTGAVGLFVRRRVTRRDVRS